MAIYRSTDIPILGTVSPCETIKATVELEWDFECLIQGGILKVITPDGVEHIVADPVPCLGDATLDAEGCLVGQANNVVQTIDYTVSPADAVAGKLTFSASWSGGYTHQSAGNTPEIGSQRALQATLALCDDGLFCNGTEFCDSEATDGSSLGICVPGTPPECGTGDQCADRGCDEDLDDCFEVDTAGRCGTSDFCVERGCNPEVGCFADDQSDMLCPDEFCTERACDAETGCVETDVSNKCGTSDQCTDRTCDEATDQCIAADTSGRCGISDFCVERSCDPEVGCAADDQSDTLCPDEFCTERTCNPAGGCVTTDVSG
jgi:hypothetical protein